ncbi:MAG: ATP-binding protein [Desulfomonilaceae bacterium]|jgi:PAS domain S-box-containing protein
MTGYYSLAPVLFSDVIGSSLMIVISFGAVWYASRLKKAEPSNLMWMYLLVLSAAMAGFSISRSVGHLVKHLLLFTGHSYIWECFRPYTGAINSIAFIGVASVTFFFPKVQRINARILSDKMALEKATQDIKLLNHNLEALVEKRTRQLSLSEKKYRGIFEGSMDMIFVLDDQLSFEDINPSGLATLGYDSPSELVGTVSLAEIFFNTSDYEEFIRDLSVSGSIKDRECRIREKSGLEVLILLSVTGTMSDAVKQKSYVGIAKDVTARIRMERQLQQADRLASLGQTAAGVAHELNTPLGIILGYTQLLLRGCNVQDGSHGDLEIIQKQTKNCKRIVQDLLKFSRDSQTKKSYVDLIECFNEVISLLGHQFEKEGVIVKTSFEPDLPKIFADGEKLEQVLVNLMVNAKQAISGNGTIAVTAKIDQEHQGILISVSDNGCGMSPKTAEKIFDPFFTTKPVGVGTGLGLSVSYGIVQAHGGRIEVESKEGVGTTFTVLLPLPDESEQNVEDMQTQAAKE